MCFFRTSGKDTIWSREKRIFEKCAREMKQAHSAQLKSIRPDDNSLEWSKVCVYRLLPEFDGQCEARDHTFTQVSMWSGTPIDLPDEYHVRGSWCIALNWDYRRAELRSRDTMQNCS